MENKYKEPITKNTFTCKSARLYNFFKSNGFKELDSYEIVGYEGKVVTNWIYDYLEIKDALTYFTENYSNNKR